MLQQFLFQPHCLSCDLPLESSQSFCFACARFLLAQDPEQPCLFPHEGPGKGFLQALRGRAPYSAAAWAHALLEKKGRLEAWRRSGVELVLPAPQAPRRGNQPSGLVLLARSLARGLGVEHAAPAFRKRKERTQHGLGLVERMDTPCFVELALPASRVKGRHALVLDDVHTTGTTLELCAYVLRKAGVARVTTFALAKQEPAG